MNMVPTHDSLNLMAPTLQKLSPTLNAHIPFRPLALPRAKSTTLLGSNNQRGSALATEIDSYRRRIQTLLHFFDCIAQHWWDHLYLYKRDLIKRPSRSADEIRSYRSRLLSRLNKFTMRTVAPAVAAVATMEAHDSVKVFPANLISPLPTDAMTSDIPVTVDNAATLLNRACTLARRIADIEKLKQRLILAALTWITSDGRDFSLRSQRVALLARHAQPCLIEHFSGVQALLTHYYRPRILTQRTTGLRGTIYDSVKTYSGLRAEPITAARLTSTNEQIKMAISQVCLPVGLARKNDTNEKVNETPLSTDTSQQQQHYILNYLSHTDDTFNNLSSSIPISQESASLSAPSQVPILPSIVLNPLSVDTSQLDWLSYEINQRAFNLHVLNSEEPEDGDSYKREVSAATPSRHSRCVEESLRSNMTPGLRSTRPRRSGIASLGAMRDNGRTLRVNRINHTLSTSTVMLGLTGSDAWFGSLHESEISGTEISLSSSNEHQLDELRRAEENTIGLALTSLRSSEELPDSGLTHSPMTAHGEGTMTPSLSSVHAHSDISRKESSESMEMSGLINDNPTGKGEEPITENNPSDARLTAHKPTQTLFPMKTRTNVRWRFGSKQVQRTTVPKNNPKPPHAYTWTTTKEIRSSTNTTSHRSQAPVKTQFSSRVRDTRPLR